MKDSKKPYDSLKELPKFTLELKKTFATIVLLKVWGTIKTLEMQQYNYTCYPKIAAVLKGCTRENIFKDVDSRKIEWNLSKEEKKKYVDIFRCFNRTNVFATFTKMC